MWLSCFPAFLGLVAIGAHASNSSRPESNVTFFGAPRYTLEGVLPIIEITEGYIRAQTDDGVGKAIGSAGANQCSANHPCQDGSCCNSNGECGFRPEHCRPASPDHCVFDCDAKAPCGEFSKDGQTSCPLNLCCSFFGTCGPSELFCRKETQSGGDTPCQRNCAEAPTPTCGTSSGTASRRIAYFEAWNSRRRGCDKAMPSQIDTSGLTHLVLAFATINPKSFEIQLMNPEDEKIYEEFLALPGRVSKWIGIGGWEFTDPGDTHDTWSAMASSQQNREVFIKSIQEFLAKWKFQGIDIDWEWPGALSRGGQSGDGKNQVSLMAELRQALSSDIGLSVVLPAQYEYLKEMDPKSLEEQVNWVSILAYDLHGTWDTFIPDLGPLIKPHTDLMEIDSSLKLLWSANITPSKVNLGVANYGRGFTVSDKNCMWYGCQYTGPSRAGPCTNIDGVLSSCEIKRIVAEKNLTPNIISGGASVKEISWDDQWVAYDDQETFDLKLQLANNRCLGGTALWAVDYDICGGGGGAPKPGISVLPSTPASVQAPSVVSSFGQATSSAAPNRSPSVVPSSHSSSPPEPSVPITSQQAPQTGSSGIVVPIIASSIPNGSSQPVSSAPSSSVGTTELVAPTSDSSSLGAPPIGTGISSASTSSQPVEASAPSSSAPAESSVSPSTSMDGSIAPSDQTSSISGSTTLSMSSIITTGSEASSIASSEPPRVSSNSGISLSNIGPSNSGSPPSSSDPWIVPSDSSASSSSWDMPFPLPNGTPTSTDIPSGTHISALPPPLLSGTPTASESLSNAPETHDTGATATQPNSTGTQFSVPIPLPTRDPDDGEETDTVYDSDEECVPNDCKVECIAWRVITFIFFKRPICPCTVKKCDKDHKKSNKKKKCKFFGCGCGWMGLPFGPGCKGPDLDFVFPDIDLPCGIFGCSDEGICAIFGCPPAEGGQIDGILGYEGYCKLPEGCEPCPPQICSGPKCTRVGGCGPKPGPPPPGPNPPATNLPGSPPPGSPPTNPSTPFPARKPGECEETDKVKVTERFIFCTEGYAVSALPSSVGGGTSSSTISTACVPFISVTLKVCPGVMAGYTTTTTTKSETTTLSSSEAPACTRAPLSLDDDEGDNMPNGTYISSTIFTWNETSIDFSKSATGFKIRTTTTLGTITTAAPSTTPGPMDKNGSWKVKLFQFVKADHSGGLLWTLYDPNGNQAGKGSELSYNKELTVYIESSNRPTEHMMPFGVDVRATDCQDVDKTRVHFSIKKEICSGAVSCTPSMITEDKEEIHMFEVESCFDKCKDSSLRPSDFWCDDLNDGLWVLDQNNDWGRSFKCGWRGF